MNNKFTTNSSSYSPPMGQGSNGKYFKINEDGTYTEITKSEFESTRIVNEGGPFSVNATIVDDRNSQIASNLHAPGAKDDQTKTMWNLLPWEAINNLVKVLTFGAKKYTPNGWRYVPNAKERYIAALLRHLYAINTGEVTDPESGLKHVHHVLCNAAFLSELEEE